MTGSGRPLSTARRALRKSSTALLARYWPTLSVSPPGGKMRSADWSSWRGDSLRRGRFAPRCYECHVRHRRSEQRTCVRSEACRLRGRTRRAWRNLQARPRSAEWVNWGFPGQERAPPNGAGRPCIKQSELNDHRWLPAGLRRQSAVIARF
jgi:hypothetical protein